MQLFTGVLKSKKRAHDSAAVGSEIGDLKDQLMRRQDPELFAETNGNLTKIEAVEDGKAQVKPKAET